MPLHDRDFWLAQLEAKKTALAALYQTLNAVAAKPQMYALDTSQSRYSEQQHSLASVKAQIRDLESEIDVLQNKIYGTAIQGRQGT